MGLLQQLVVEVRTIRAENRIPSPQKIEVWLKAPGAAERDVIPEIRHDILALANASEVKVVDAYPDGRTFLKGVAGSWEVAIPLEGLGAWAAGQGPSRKRDQEGG